MSKNKFRMIFIIKNNEKSLEEIVKTIGLPQ